MTRSDMLAGTAREVLFGDDVDVPGELARRLRQSDALASGREDLRVVGGAVWDGAYEQLSAMATDFLDLDIATVLVRGWRKHQELVAAAAVTSKDDSTVVVPLGARDLRLVRHPRVDVQLGTLTLPAVRFELAVDVAVLGVAGVVSGGRLIALTGGRCTVTVALSAGGRLLANGTRTVDPHLSVPLGTGIALGVPPQRTGSPEGADGPAVAEVGAAPAP